MAEDAKQRIVLITDQHDFRYALTDWLRPRYFVISLANGEQLTRELDAINPDAVIFDARSPNLDAAALWRKIKSGPRASLPILFLTAESKYIDREVLLEKVDQLFVAV